MKKAIYIDCTELAGTLLTSEVRSLIPELSVHMGDPDPVQLAVMLDGAAVVLNGHTVMDEATLSAAASIKSIIFLGSGPASYINLAAASRLGIRVRAITGYGDRTIAEHTIALMLAAARRVAVMDRALRRGIWEPLEGVEIAGKTLGVIGTGGTGREVIRLAAAFGMHILAWNRGPPAVELPCRLVPLDTLLGSSDVISVHLALTPETEGLLDARRLSLLRPGVIVVNTARGGIFDEEALITALRSERIAHAALDVFTVEPLAAGHPFTELENVTITAHAAFKTPEANRRLLSSALQRLRQDLAALTVGEELSEA